VQGKTVDSAEQLLRDARAVEARALSPLCSKPSPRARHADHARAGHPTIASGRPRLRRQILVVHDLLASPLSRHKIRAQIRKRGRIISRAVREYAADVRSGNFPTDNESYHSARQRKKTTSKFRFAKCSGRGAFPAGAFCRNTISDREELRCLLKKCACCTISTPGQSPLLNSRRRANSGTIHQADGLSFPSVRDTLAHIFGAEWIWLERFQGRSPAGLPDATQYPDANTLGERWANSSRAF